jgi:hypothetical protein
MNQRNRDDDLGLGIKIGTKNERIAMKLSCILILILASALSSKADGICKDRAIPSGYLAVKAFYSPECDKTGDPFTANAWELSPATEGVVACALPDYQQKLAQQLHFMECEPTFSESCDQRIDGLENATVMRSPQECVNRKLPKGKRLVCRSAEEMPSGRGIFALVHSEECPPFASQNTPMGKNAWLAGFTNGLYYECADSKGLDPLIWIVRRFHTEDCPDDKSPDGTASLNAWFVQFHPAYGSTLTVCQPFNNGYRAARLRTSLLSLLCGGLDDSDNAAIVTLDRPADVRGLWKDNSGKKFFVQQADENLYFSDGERYLSLGDGFLVSSTKITFNQTNGPTLQGTIQAGGERINWDNGMYWIQYGSTSPGAPPP